MKSSALTYSPVARWGLLVTTLAMGVVLVVTSLLGYLSARDAGASVVRARGRDLLFVVQRSILLAGAPDSETLGEIVEDLKSQGLRAISLTGPSGMLASAGDPYTKSFGPLPTASTGSGPLFDIDWSAGCARAVAPSEFGRGSYCQGNHKGCNRGGRNWMHNRAKTSGQLAIVFEPVVARAMVSRAGWDFGVSLASAILLLLLALVFFRLSVRAELIQRQLDRKRKLALLGEMSAVLGHELRNPLASLKGHAQLLVEKLPDDHPGRSGAQTVVREAIRLEELSGQVLDFARTGELDMETVNPADLVHAAVDELDSIRVSVDAGDAPDAWRLDRTRMQQVLVNLIRNALQASGENEQVDLVLTMEEGSLLFAVRDRGPGLVAGEESRIFEPFYTKRVKGTGLGLAVARAIVEKHGGEITACNHPEGGAQFVVRLPPG